MIERTKGIVLSALRYGDDSMVVNILTRKRGTLPFMVKVPRSRRATVKTQLLRPLTLLEIEIDWREKMQMQRIKEMRVDIPYSTLPYDPVKEAILLFLSEALYHALKHEERNEPLYDFLQNALEWLDLSSRNFANFHLCLLVQLTRYLGFFPNISNEAPGKAFNLTEGCYTDTIPLHGHYLTHAEAACIPYLLKMNFATMHCVRLGGKQRGKILRLINLYYRLHIPDFPELKSLDVLTELFD